MTVKAADTAIYVLVDPSTNALRYVGKTTQPETRMKDHLRARSNVLSRKECWVKSLAAKIIQPEMKIMTWVPSAEADEAERTFINLFRSFGFDLVNGTDGGDGGAITDPDALRRIREAHLGSTHSDETKELMSRSQRAFWAGNEAAREAARERNLRLGLTPPRKGYGEENDQSKLTEADVVEIRRLLNSGVALADVHNAFDFVSKQAVWFAGTGKTWVKVDATPFQSKSRNRFTDEDFSEMKRLHAEGVSQKEISELFGTCPSHVSRIVRNATRRVA